MSACLLLLLAAAPVNRAADWPQFRGPTGDGHAPAGATPPTEWAEGKNARWKVAVHDKGWSSPVVVGNQVWVTTAAEDGKTYFAVCLDRATGKVVHDVHLFDEANPPDIQRFNSYATPTTVVADGRVFAHFGSHGTACLDAATGKVLWTRRDLPCDHYRGPASSPVLHAGKLFLTFDGYDKQYVAALDAGTGDTVWTKDRALPFPDNGDLKKAFATPSVFAVDGVAQLVSPAATGTVALDPATGKEIWRVIHGGMNEAGKPVLAHGLIYLTTGHTAGLVAVKAGGRGDVTPTGVAWKADKVAPTRPSVLVQGDELYMVNDTGVVFCLDAKTGTKHWQERLDGKFSASPVLANGNLYFAGENGKTFVVAAKKEYTLVATNKLDAGCLASPAAVGKELFLRTRTHLYCIAE